MSFHDAAVAEDYEFKKSHKLNVYVQTDHVLNFLGEWYDDTAAGANVTQRMDNQCYVLRIQEPAVEEDGKLTVVLQLMQETKRHSDDLLYIRLDIFRVRGAS